MSFSVKEIALYKGRTRKEKPEGRELSACAGEAEVVSAVSATCHYLSSV